MRTDLPTFIRLAQDDERANRPFLSDDADPYLRAIGEAFDEWNRMHGHVVGFKRRQIEAIIRLAYGSNGER